jgi:hypothetical protein
MVSGMKKDIEIFRGAGAMAALEAVIIRAVLAAEGIPSRGGRMKVIVAARHYLRASELIAAAFGAQPPYQEAKIGVPAKKPRTRQAGA